MKEVKNRRSIERNDGRILERSAARKRVGIYNCAVCAFEGVGKIGAAVGHTLCVFFWLFNFLDDRTDIFKV